MRVIEARFHFFPDDDHPITVGHIVWDSDAVDAWPRVEASYSRRRRERPVEIVAALKCFVQQAGPDAFRGLQSLRLPCWSFVDVSASWPVTPPATTGAMGVHRP